MLRFASARKLLFAVAFIVLIHDTRANVSFEEMKLTISRTEGVFSNWNGTISENGLPSLGITVGEPITEDVWVYFIAFYDELRVAEFNGTVCDMLENESYALSKDIRDAAKRGGTPIPENCPIPPGYYDLRNVNLAEVPSIGDGRMSGYVDVDDESGQYVKINVVFSIEAMNAMPL